MSRDKQIEEMCAIMADTSYLACEDAPLVPESAGICDKVSCHRCKEARLLMNAGYRKVDSVTFMGGIVEQMRADVAEEIFAEIEKLIIRRMIADSPLIDDRLITDIAELKKKYTEEGK